jgi:all-trans-retinol 13,14-reductase
LALPPASAHVCLYLGFEGDIRSAGASAANKWFYDTWDMEDDIWPVEKCVDPDHPVPRASVLYCSFPSLKDPNHEPGQRVRHTGEVVTFVPWELFAPWRDEKWRKRGDEYDRLKQRLQDALLEQFLSRVPGLRDMVRYVELSTPVSTDHFCRPMSGSIYGIEPTPDRFRNPDLRPRSRIAKLYYAGSEVATVGVMGAMMGGVLATTAAEPIRAIKYLRSLG